MKIETQDLIFDLLIKKAVYGLSEDEDTELGQLGGTEADKEFRNLEITAVAINMAGLSGQEALPAHLYSKIYADAGQFVGSMAVQAEAPWPPVNNPVHVRDAPDADSPSASWFGWLGWAVAAAACIVLAINLWSTRTHPPVEEARNPAPVQTPQVLTPAQAREAMLNSTSGMVTAAWAAGNVKDIKQISGDVVWSDENQSGFMRFRGLPVNDPSKETYQLWIFDKTQDKATPIDGGTFNVDSDGELVIPINAKLKANGPQMFAISMEKPGGVVVSKREKLAAIAKVESQAS